MTDQIKEYIIQKVNELINADSCCPEAKKVAKNWLDKLGTKDEASASKDLIDELKADVNSIDSIIALVSSKEGEAIFGKEGAQNMLAEAKTAKAKGNKYCICAACQAGGAILDKANDLLS